VRSKHSKSLETINLANLPDELIIRYLATHPPRTRILAPNRKDRTELFVGHREVAWIELKTIMTELR
jgi:hypothetical protein